MTLRQEFFTRTGLALWIAAFVGAICLFPYALALAPETLDRAAQQLELPIPAIIAISLLQSAFTLGFATFVGLWAARKLGLGAPLVDAILQHEISPYSVRRVGSLAIALGATVGLLVIGLDLIAFHAVSDSLQGAAKLEIPPWKGFLASFYGGISEEILLRLFLLSMIALGIRGLVRLVSRSQGPDRLSTSVFWTANIIAAVLFGLGHLPATAEIVPLTTLVVFRAILLNGIVGVVAGFLFWRRGIEMAMLCHFSADIVLHVLFPLVR